MEKTRAGIQSVEVGFTLLEVLTQAKGPLMLRDLAATAGMSAAKAHRYLVSFQRLGLVVQDPGNTRYDLGPAALQLGLASLSRLDAVKMARERIPGLLDDVGHHTLALAVWGNHGPTIVHWEESQLSVTVNLRLGDVMPLLSSATGRCFAAYAVPAAIADKVNLELAQIQKLGQHNLPQSLSDVQRVMNEVRERGMARVVETLLPGIVGFCAPVFDSDGHIALGLLVMGSVATLDAAWEGAVANALRTAAHQLSRDLGFRV
jgi:DNA-binding IclR family transcriptional regulator